MKIRAWEPKDDEQLREIVRRMGQVQTGDEGRYIYPDPRHRLHFGTGVVEDDDGKIIASLTGRRTCEAAVVIDPTRCSPRIRWEALKALYRAGAEYAWREGFDEAHAPVPPWLARYGRRLSVELGFQLDGRTPYYIDLFRLFSSKG